MSTTTDSTLGAPACAAAALLAEADRLLDELHETALWTVGDSDLLHLARAMETTRRKFEASRFAVVAEVAARNAAVQAGARSTVQWLVDKTRVGRGEARRTVRAAQRLADHAPAVRAALASGAIGLGHAVVIADVMSLLHSRSTRFGSPVTYDVLQTAERTMLDLAATLDPAQLGVAGTHLVDRVDPDFNPCDADEAALAEEVRREFTCTPLPDGSGRLSGEGGGPGSTVFVTTTKEALEGKLASQNPPTLDFGTELPIESLRRLACDAWIIPAVLATTSQPLDIGRASRTIPLGMRRALIARDQHCAFPGCGLPPAWCDGHHILFWSNGGDTALHNLVLVCGHHHRLLHHGDWRVVMADDGLPTFLPPPWLDPDIATADPSWRVLLEERFPRHPRAG